VVVLEVLGVGLWAVLGLGGAWWLVTGRRLAGLPRGYREGWPLRVMGLAYVLFPMFLVYEVLQGSFAPESVIFSYAFFAVALGVYVYHRRKVRAA
jgi:drug/metabolite transporter (DMT)-like permease